MIIGRVHMSCYHVVAQIDSAILEYGLFSLYVIPIDREGGGEHIFNVDPCGISIIVVIGYIVCPPSTESVAELLPNLQNNLWGRIKS